MLGNGDECRLVVRRSVDGCKTVCASGETCSDVGVKNTANSSFVQSLEECELCRVCRSRLSRGGHLLDDDVRVADDLAGRVDLLGCGKVVLVRIHEVARLEVGDRHFDRECRVRSDDSSVRGELELGRRHLRLGGDDTHRRWVARAGNDLLAVGERQVRGGAEVDEVVGRCQRGDLASFWLVLTVVCKALGNHGWVKS